jgi:uncharacterized protein YndB with AHSA1/START domain
MGTVTVSRTLDHSANDVWSVLADFGGIHRWSASVESSPINAGTPPTGVGAERNCHLYDGNHIQERITQSVDQRRLALEIFDTSMPLRSADAVFELSPSAEGGTELTMTMSYVVKFGLLGKAMDGLLLRRKMTSSLDRLLITLDEHLTTGAVIDKGWSPNDTANVQRASA